MFKPPVPTTDPRQLQAQQAAFAKTAANQLAARQAAPGNQPTPSAQAYAPTAANPAQAANYQQAVVAAQQAAAPVQARPAPGLSAPAVMQRPGNQPGLNQVPQPIPAPQVFNPAAQAQAAARSQAPGVNTAPQVYNPAAQAQAAAKSQDAGINVAPDPKAAERADALARKKVLNSGEYSV